MINNDSKTSPAVHPSGDESKASKRHPVRLALIILFLCLLILLWSTPYLASTKTGLNLLLTLLNKKTDSRIQIDDLSLSWLGPGRVNHVKIHDNQNRPILQLDQAAWSQGLWQTLFSPANFQQITLDAPQLLMPLPDKKTRKDDDSKKLNKKKFPENIVLPPALSALQGNIFLRNGNLRLTRPNGPAYTLDHIDIQIELNTLNDIKGTAHLNADNRDAISARFDLKNILDQHQINFDNATGSFLLKTDNDMEIAPLLEFFEDQTSAGGKIRLNVESTLQNGLIQTDVSCSLQNFHAVRTGSLDIQPININLDSHIRADQNQITAQTRLQSNAGLLQAKFSYHPAPAPSEISLDELVSAALAGGKITLPDFILESDGQLDLPALAAAVPALLKIRPDLNVTDGQLRIDKFYLQGGPAPQANLTLLLNNLTVLKNQQKIACEPVSANFDLLLEPNIGLRIKNAELNSTFARLNSRGTVQQLHGDFTADLDKLRQQFTNFLEPNSFPFTGTLQGTIDINRSENEQVNINLALAGSRLQYQSDQRPFHTENLQLQYQGRLDLRDKKLEKIVTTSAALNLDNQIIAQASGSYDLPHQTLNSQINLRQAELAYLLPQESSPALTGRVAWVGSCNSSSGIVTLEGKGALTDFQVKSEEKSFREPLLEFTHLTILEQSKESLMLKNTRFTSQTISAQFTGSIDKYNSLCLLDLKGNYEGSWEKITALLHEIAPDTAQTFAFTGNIGGNFHLTGPARQPASQPAYRNLNAALDLGWSAANIYGLELGETKLSPTMTEGTIQFADANIPASEGNVLLDGLILNLTGPEPALQIPAKLQILKHVHITADFARTMLSRINPIFADLAALEGFISLQLENVTLPLSEKIKQTGTGRGHLDLTQLQVRPEGLLAHLFRLGNLDSQKTQSLKVPSLDFSIKNGRIHYDNFILSFEDKFDLKFYGSVGFDDTLELVVSLPLSAALLEQFGIKGPTRDYVRLLADTRIDVPLAGTRLQPKLDFSKVNIQPVIDKAAQTLIKEKSSEVLDKILKSQSLPPPEPQKQEKTEPKPKTEPKTEPKPVEQQIFDIFTDILKEKTKTPKKDKPND